MNPLIKMTAYRFYAEQGGCSSSKEELLYCLPHFISHTCLAFNHPKVPQHTWRACVNYLDFPFVFLNLANEILGNGVRLGYYSRYTHTHAHTRERVFSQTTQINQH